MTPPDRTATSRLQAITVTALMALLIAAALPSLVQVRRAGGEATLERMRERFSSSVGALHGRWLMEGGSARALRIGEQIVHMSKDGWPTIDPRHAQQDTAAELLAVLVRPAESLKGWQLFEQPQEGAGIARFYLSLAGGGTFAYDGATGRIFEPSE